MTQLTPYEISLSDQPFWVLDSPEHRTEYLQDHPEVHPDELGYIALAAFRNKTYVDYVAVGSVDDVTGQETWTKAHEQYEWFDWMAGIIWRDAERDKQLKKTERKLGRFLITFGWAPNYYLETAPSDSEMDSYIQHVVNKDVIDGNLIFKEEDDDDGA